MLEKPRLKDEQIITCVKTCYGLTITDLQFIARGYDSCAGVYRAQVGEQSYFLKVKSDHVPEWSVRLPRYLQSQGFTQVVAPLPTVTHDLWGTVDGFTVLLYPFIEQTEGDLSDDQWIAYGAILKQLHSTRLPPDLLGQLPRENYIPHPQWMALIRQIHATIASQVYYNPIQQQLAAFWQERHQDIGRIIDRTEQLSGELQAHQHTAQRELVLCHSDIHTWNLLRTPEGALFVVDWDQPMLAPRERDLMFVTVGAFLNDKRKEDLFFQGYGPVGIDPRVMAYYRYERTMEDLAGFAEVILLLDMGDVSRQDALAWFMEQFAPCGSVESAFEADRWL